MRRRDEIRLGLMVSVFMAAAWIWAADAVGQMDLPDPRNSVQALAVDSGGQIYMGTFGKGIFKSRDGGSGWEEISNGLKDPYIMTIMIRAAHEGGPGPSGEMIFAGGARFGVFRSTDQGRHWVQLNDGLKSTEIAALVFDAQDRLYAATGNGVFRSEDFGEHWTAYNTGLDNVLVRSLIIHREGMLFAGTGGRGIFTRGPGDAQWEQISRGFEKDRGLRENFIRVLTLGGSGSIYAGTMDGGIFLSRDKGRSWNDLSQGLINMSIRAILLDRKGVLYLGTGRGIFIRGPADSRWIPINGDLEDLNIQSMAMDSQGQIYAGTAQNLYKGSTKGDWIPVTTRLFGGSRKGT